jgi:transposase InsO family protein
MVHGDLCGPVTPPTHRGSKFFLLLMDDFSRYMWISLLSSKDQAAAKIRRIHVVAERKSGNLLGVLRTDRGKGEFTIGHFREYCAELGIRRELITPYSPQQNGVVERRNQSVMAVARCMMKAEHLPNIFGGGGEAINCVVYLLNRVVSKSTGGKNPYELWTGSKPAMNHLKVFRCVAHVKNTRPHLKKLEDRSHPMML